MAECKINMKTNVYCHKCKFNWEIQNVLKMSRLLYGERFSLNSKCRKKFRSAIKITKRRSDVFTLVMGFQRMDKCRDDITLVTILQLCSSNGNVFVSRTAKFTCDKDGKTRWCISGKFSDPSQKRSKSRVSDCEIHSSTTKSLSSSDSEDERAFHLHGEVLVVKGVIKIYGCCVVSRLLSNSESSAIRKSNEAEMAEESVHEAINDFRYAYESNFFTDVSLKVDGFYIRAHKFVLCARCPYFRKILYGIRPAEVIDITDMNKLVLESFLRFLYTGIVGCVRFDTIRELYSLSDKYEVPSLKNNCSQVIKSHVKDTNACDILKLADLHKDIVLKNYALNFIIDNFENTNIMSGFSSLVTDSSELASELMHVKRLRRI